MENDNFLVLVKSLSATLKSYSSELLNISWPTLFKIETGVFFCIIITIWLSNKYTKYNPESQMYNAENQ